MPKIPFFSKQRFQQRFSKIRLVTVLKNPAILKRQIGFICEYFLQETPSLLISLFLVLWFSVMTAYQVMGNTITTKQMIVAICGLVGTFLCLSISFVRDVYFLLLLDPNQYDFNTDKKNLLLDEKIKKAIHAESEAYQEKRGGYSHKIEKMAQSVRKEYGILHQDELGLEFFSLIASDLNFSFWEEQEGELPNQINGIAFDNGTSKEKKLVIPKFNDDNLRQKLACAHEIGHILFGIGYYSALDALKDKKPNMLNLYRYYLNSERDANAFAAALVCFEHDFRNYLKMEEYDLEKIREKYYPTLSYETIAHRTIAVSKLPLHFCKTDLKGKIIKRYSNSGLDFDVFQGESFKNSSVKACIKNNKQVLLPGKDHLFAVCSLIKDKEGNNHYFFCFSRKINRYDRHKVCCVCTIGCRLKDATGMRYFNLQEKNNIARGNELIEEMRNSK